MNIEINSIVTLDNNEEYEVINKLSNNILLLTKRDKIELSLVKVKEENGKKYFNRLTEQEYQQAMIELTKMKLN